MPSSPYSRGLYLTVCLLKSQDAQILTPPQSTDPRDPDSCGVTNLMPPHLPQVFSLGLPLPPARMKSPELRGNLGCVGQGCRPLSRHPPWSLRTLTRLCSRKPQTSEFNQLVLLSEFIQVSPTQRSLSRIPFSCISRTPSPKQQQAKRWGARVSGALALLALAEKTLLLADPTPPPQSCRCRSQKEPCGWGCPKPTPGLPAGEIRCPSRPGQGQMKHLPRLRRPFSG